MIIDEACPAVFHKTFCSFWIGRFIFISLFIYNSNIFFHGSLPLL